MTEPSTTATDTNQPVAKKKLSSLELLLSFSAGGVVVGINGWIGKDAYSFFNPVAAQSVGGFGSLVGMGLLVYPLAIIPTLVTRTMLDKSAYFKNYPLLKEFIKDSLSLAYCLAAVAATAAIVGNPIGASLVCYSIVPAILTVLNTLANVIGVVRAGNSADLEPTTPAVQV